ncbi:MAG: helix-turn-helix transcriptional regulator [Coriobacteriia bacterium]|nr:helix-turn-helix transcriptional regulator [Coriobacteriia bacterium]
MDDTRIGSLIRAHRRSAGLTLDEVAERVGVTAGALSHIESGRRLPSPRTALDIGHALGIPDEEMLSALDEEHSTRRRDSVAGKQKPSSPARDLTYMKAMPIEELFDVAGTTPPVSARLSMRSASPAPSRDGRSARTTARWSVDREARLEALDDLAMTAAEAIRTLTGLLDDNDPAIAQAATRQLAELGVKPPNR